MAWLLGDKSVLQQRQLRQVAKCVLEVNVATLDVPVVGVLVLKLRHKREVVEKLLGGDSKKSKGEAPQDLGHCSMFRGPEYVVSAQQHTTRKITIKVGGGERLSLACRQSMRVVLSVVLQGQRGLSGRQRVAAASKGAKVPRIVNLVATAVVFSC